MDAFNALADQAEPAVSSRGLPYTTQRYLGDILRWSYLETLQATPERLAALLVKVQGALEKQADADVRAFHSDLIEMLPRLQKFALSLTKNPAAADDLVQDTVLRALRSREHFQVGTNLGAWLFTILRNVFYSSHRRSKTEFADIDDDHAKRAATVPEQPGRLDLLDAQTALERLPATMREALILVGIENLSYEEAACVMGCQIGTVKSRVWRAREQLARVLGFNAGEVGADSQTLSALRTTT